MRGSYLVAWAGPGGPPGRPQLSSDSRPAEGEAAPEPAAQPTIISIFGRRGPPSHSPVICSNRGGGLGPANHIHTLGPVGGSGVASEVGSMSRRKQTKPLRLNEDEEERLAAAGRGGGRQTGDTPWRLIHGGIIQFIQSVTIRPE